ncbi:ABC transporter ATP-binding protein [Isoptericola variabilis]|uniref:ATP-binding cassette domain-containing protein n=1 Tax=Isoptericola variabilis TaxID=139208 RepID=UPI00031CB0CF|nr:ABC transporter ATP-binding protein [Isoptericola variabilis]TWH32074.1 ABC-type multidrug transport system fused ATPase/permease subunit [Isoptericola variabilis J7]
MVDDDTHAVGALVRRQPWGMGRTVIGSVPLWVVAGLTWWPAWVLFPVLGTATVLLVRPLLGEIARRKVVEERAWTDDAAAFEEAVAARDDLRTSLGQAFAVRRLAELSAAVHRTLDRVLVVETRMTRRAGLLLHALLGGVAVAGVALAAGGDLSVAGLVTLFLVTATFVGQIDQLARHLPDLQEGVGAAIRIRQLLEAEPEPAGGRPVPDGPLDIELRDLHFAYAGGTFALQGVSLHVPAGQTVALVGRTGSGKSTLASLLSRADVPRSDVEAAVAELRLQEWVDGLPDGLDTLLGPGGTSLSAGEEQLVAFARLLVRDVHVVVLDEATARMDPHTEARVGATSKRAALARADRVVVLDDGEVADVGAWRDLSGRWGHLAG